VSDPRSVSPSPHAPIAPAGLPAGATVCTACALLCDDAVVRPAEGRFERLCDRGTEAFRHHHAATAAPRDMATIDGRPADPAAAVSAAAERLSGARRVLLTGLNDLTIEGVTAACDVGEGIGAVIVPATDEAPPPGGTTIARCGEITAAWEELRDRADLVVFWGHDPADSHPRFSERFVAPPLPHPPLRRTISVGRTPLRAPPSADHVHLPLDDIDDDVDLARLLQAGLLGRPLGAAPERLRGAAVALGAAIDAARCVGFVTGRHDPLGLSRWGVIGIVRALSRRLPAFEVPLDSAPQAPNAAGATAMLTWRYGAAASTTRGDGSPYDAVDLVATGAVDAVLAVGRLPPRLDGSIRERIDPRWVVRISPDDGAGGGVFLRCRELFDEQGTLLRADGRTVEMAGGAVGPLPSTVALLAAIRRQLAHPDPIGTEGGRS